MDFITTTTTNKDEVIAKTKANVDHAIQVILEKNFDADSKTCLITLLKILDNVLQKPNNAKVRSIKTSNATIQAKIIHKHGHHVLRVCGFILEEKSMTEDERYVLQEENEDTEFLIQVRHTIAKIAIHELNLKADALPSFKPPPPKITVSQSTDNNGVTTTTTNTGFDVYAGRRYDGQSASLGTQLGPPVGWKSKTVHELDQLKAREDKLSKKVSSSSSSTNRQWTVFLPGPKMTTTPTTTTATPSIPVVRGMSLKPNANNNNSHSNNHKEDKQLLAKHFQDQFAKKALQEKHGGFTTKAMRDLEKIKKRKVYSHTQLAITFPDGIVVKANFQTNELLGVVIEGLQSHVLFMTDTIKLPSFELYTTPPRTVLDPTKSLKALGLVPAAKIYVSWKQAGGLTKIPIATLGMSWYIRPELLLKQNNNDGSDDTTMNTAIVTGPAMPTSVSILGGNTKSALKQATGAVNDAIGSTTTKRKKKTKEEKAAEMMKRMLGGGGGM